MGVSGGGEDFEDVVVDGEEGNIESSTSEIVDDDLGLLAFLSHSVRQSGCGGFIEDSKDFETSNFACVFGSLALGIVEV